MRSVKMLQVSSRLDEVSFWMLLTNFGMSEMHQEPRLFHDTLKLGLLASVPKHPSSYFQQPSLQRSAEWFHLGPPFFVWPAPVVALGHPRDWQPSWGSNTQTLQEFCHNAKRALKDIESFYDFYGEVIACSCRLSRNPLARLPGISRTACSTGTFLDVKQRNLMVICLETASFPSAWNVQ